MPVRWYKLMDNLRVEPHNIIGQVPEYLFGFFLNVCVEAVLYVLIIVKDYATLYNLSK